MAKIYISYNQVDREFAIALARILRDQLKHEITIDMDSLVPGQDWRRALESGLRSSDVFVVLLSESALRSHFVLSEIGAARAYAESSESKLLIPVVLDAIQIPPVVADLMAIMAPERDTVGVAVKIDYAISAFEGKRAAAEEKQKDLSAKIESSSAEYIDDAISSLLRREKRDRWLGLSWQCVGFIALAVGVAFVLATISKTRAAGEANPKDWIDFAYLALRSVLSIALLGACARYAFVLGKSYISEALKSADRLHAIAFGKLYLRVFGSKIEWQEIKEAFAHWNIDTTSTFSNLTSMDIDPKVIESLVDLTKALGGKAGAK